MSDRVSRKSWLWVLALSAAIRIVWVVLVPVVPTSDCYVYDGAAQRLAQGLPYTIDAASTYKTAHWPVGTAFMYSIVYRVFDPTTSGYGAATVLNVLISLAVVALTMAAAARWFGARAGTIAGLAMACWPMHIQFTTVIASEPVFTALMLGGMLLWPRLPVKKEDDAAGSNSSARKSELALLAVSGMLFGLATLMRPTALLFPIVMAGIDFLRSRRVMWPAIHAAAAMVVLLAVLSPWTIRNYREFGRVVLVSTNGGANMWMGNNPDTTGHYQLPPPMRPNQNEAQWDKDLGDQAKAFIKQEPVAFVKRTVTKAVRLHDRETIGVAWNLEGLKRFSSFFDTGPGSKLLKAVSSGYWYLMLVLGSVGVVILARREGVWRALTHPTVVFFAYFTGVHAIMVIQDRYHYPITPMVASLASMAIAHVWTRRVKA